MDIKYTTDKSTQILIALLKAHGINKVVASPGTTNAVFVASIQNDKDFTIYSSVDERSAAYMACGLAQSSGEPVVITCTEATASRNYFPGLTEAYYRKLPILAITGNHGTYNIGHLHTQSIDRSQPPKDTVKYSTSIGHCNNPEDEWHINVEINKAILELTRNGGGPVHIDLRMGKQWDFHQESLPPVRVIKRIGNKDDFPILPCSRIAIVIGAHRKFTPLETSSIETFCERYDAAVFADLISGYHGKYKVNAAILMAQQEYKSPILNAELAIHLGEMGWSYAKAKQTWRVCEDGEIRDTFHNLSYLFDMDIVSFFEKCSTSSSNENKYFECCKKEIDSILSSIPELPFSNAWLALNTIKLLPNGIVLHTGILNSFRVWNFYAFDESIDTNCNFGGFGIDGGVSTLIGSSLIHPQKLHIGVFGDLAFFYDMNSLGNRHVGNNVRILMVNNGKGNEFRNCIHPASRFGQFGDDYIAASGHFGFKSPKLVCHYAEDLGFVYMTASTKEEYLEKIKTFLNPEVKEAPIIFEVFTCTKDESDALKILYHLKSSVSDSFNVKMKNAIGSLIGDKGMATIKKIIKK